MGRLVGQVHHALGGPSQLAERGLRVVPHRPAVVALDGPPGSFSAPPQKTTATGSSASSASRTMPGWVLSVDQRNRAACGRCVFRALLRDG